MIRNRTVTPVASIAILLLAPLALGAKGGCTHAVVGDEGDCKTNCGDAGMDDGNTGGSGGSGGSHATGGAPATGGTTGSGGGHATGGAPATGGTTGSGGGHATGGAPTTGGTVGSTGGGPASGGSSGSTATGGGPAAGGTAGTGTSGTGGGTATCGGLRGSQCADGQFCDFPLATNCGAADQTGTCQPIPDACTKEYVPVCGCDDKTYGNACDAHAAGIAVAATGECATTPDFCGGIAGIGCPDGQYCSFPPEAHCGDGDMTGSCAVRPEGCTEQYDPVCGCDGMTYGNACDAANHGISVQTTGECPK